MRRFSSDSSIDPNPNHTGVPTAPNTVASVLNTSSADTVSTLSCPRLASIGAASATGVPNPEAPALGGEGRKVQETKEANGPGALDGAVCPGGVATARADQSKPRQNHPRRPHPLRDRQKQSR